jgi:hypothetical protein
VFVTKTYLFPELFSYFPFISEVVTGTVSSFLMHLLVLGWKTKFDVIVIE